jgi:hypothetical protein
MIRGPVVFDRYPGRLPGTRRSLRVGGKWGRHLAMLPRAETSSPGRREVGEGQAATLRKADSRHLCPSSPLSPVSVQLSTPSVRGGFLRGERALRPIHGALPGSTYLSTVDSTSRSPSIGAPPTARSMRSGADGAIQGRQGGKTSRLAHSPCEYLQKLPVKGRWGCPGRDLSAQQAAHAADSRVSTGARGGKWEDCMEKANNGSGRDPGSLRPSHRMDCGMAGRCLVCGPLPQGSGERANR